MPVPSSIHELSQTPGSNFPSGSESPIGADDYFRTYASYTAQHRDGKGYSAEVDVASAATCDIGGQDSFFVRVTGTTTITSFGTNFSAVRYVRFAASLVLTHNASTLILPGGANITTAAGDTCIAVPLAAGWYVTEYRRATIPVTGGVIDRAYAEYTTNADLTTIIPGDDTLPQSTEGTQIISVSFTPKSATNRVRLSFRGEGTASAITSIACALFSNASTNALRASATRVSDAGGFVTVSLVHEYVPGVTTAITFSIRVGPISASTVRLNGSTANRVFGGAAAATLVIEEIAA